MTNIFRNAQDKSPGGGQPNPGEPPPNNGTPPNPAQGGTPPPPPQYVTKEDLSQMLEGMTEKVSNTVFAGLRRAGVFAGGKESPPPADKSLPPPSAPVPSSLTEDQVMNMWEKQNAFQRSMAGVQMTAGQMKWAQEAFKASKVETADDAEKWAKTYLEEQGLKNQQPPGAPANKPPLNSDKGAPTTTPRDIDWVMQTDPLNIRPDEIAQLRAKHGSEKADMMLREAVLSRLSNVRVVPDRQNPKR